MGENLIDTTVSSQPTADRPKRICLWSGPRNVSTALMYSFAQRADTRVFDEPLYGHYLRVTGAKHPGREEVLRAMETDGEKVVRETVLGTFDRPLLFQKHMAHHLIQIDRSFLRCTANVFLVRDPEQMLPSLERQVPVPRLADTGLAVQSALINRLHRLGQDPPVLDAKDLLTDPPAVLESLCCRLSIDFDPAMLDWSAGPRPEDGVWAPHWYHNVHRSTGFMPYQAKSAPFPERLKGLLKECRPHYQYLRQWAIRA